MNDERKEGGFSKLEIARQEAMKFTISTVQAMSIVPDGELQRRADDEVAAAPGQILLDNGVSAGMKTLAGELIRHINSAWGTLKNNVDAELEYYSKEFNALNDMQADIKEAEEDKKNKIVNFENACEKNHGYKTAHDAFKEADKNYKDLRQKLGRGPNMFASSFLYWVFLLLTLVAETFVNFWTFLEYWKINFPAIGTSLVLGVLLGLAAHLHGEAFVQWSYRFSRSRRNYDAVKTDKISTFWMLGIATLSLLIVIVCVGGARWHFEVQDMLNHPGKEHNPVGYVAIGLMGNLGVWMLGVVLSWLAHDRNPDYMDAAKTFKKAEKKWKAESDKARETREQIEAEADEKIEQAKNQAKAKLSEVEREYNAKIQVEKRNEEIEDAINDNVRNVINQYKTVLSRTAQQRNVSFVNSDASAEKVDLLHGISGQQVPEVGSK